MVNLVLNRKIKIPFIGAFNPLNFFYSLTNYRLHLNEGEVIFKEILFNNDVKEKIHYVSLESDYGSIDIDGNIVYFIENNLITINIKVLNIFQVYNDLLKFFLKSDFKSVDSTYECFSTGLKCNLQCPYCVVDANSVNYIPNYSLALQYIKNIHEITISNCSISRTSMRIMGGEPLLDLNLFNNIIEYSKNIYDEVFDLWIYSNTTVNIHEFFNMISRYKDYINHITFVMSVDTFDLSKSLRFTQREMLIHHHRLIQDILSKYKSNWITIAANLMYLSYDITLDTAKKLYDYGLDFLQISYNEFSRFDERLNYSKSIHKLYNELENMGIKRLKDNLGDNLWIHFSIDDGYQQVWNMKHSLTAPYTIAVCNNY